jgi:hypothetical protein
VLHRLSKQQLLESEIPLFHCSKFLRYVTAPAFCAAWAGLAQRRSKLRVMKKPEPNDLPGTRISDLYTFTTISVFAAVRLISSLVKVCSCRQPTSKNQQQISGSLSCLCPNLLCLRIQLSHNSTATQA